MAIQHLQALKQGQCLTGGLAQVGTETGCYAKNDCTAWWIGEEGLLMKCLQVACGQHLAF